MVVAILDHRTRTVKVITVSEKDLKPFDNDVEEYLSEKDLIHNECDWIANVLNLVINDSPIGFLPSKKCK